MDQREKEVANELREMDKSIYGSDRLNKGQTLAGWKGRSKVVKRKDPMLKELERISRGEQAC